MCFTFLLRKNTGSLSAEGLQWFRAGGNSPCAGRHRRAGRWCRPFLECLEDRTLLSIQFPLSFPAGTNPAAIATGDFNGDGKLDVAVVDRGDPNSGA
jgi:hypothetical protein